jgi:hypothetical protein
MWMTPSDLLGTTQHPGPSAAPKRLTTQNRAALALVPARVTQARTHYSPLALWHLLSLDAPTVAALWTFTIARAVGLHLPWTGPVAMFVAVWMLYAADRLLDARPLLHDASALDLEERHRFHHRHRRRFLLVIVAASCVLAALLHYLDPAALHLYTLLATLLGAWFLLIHARPLHNFRLPKELAVGLFFPAAVFIPTVAREPGFQLALLPSALLLASICTLNCLFLYAWEHPGLRPFAHFTTRWATRHLASLAALVSTASFTSVCLSLLLPNSLSSIRRGNAVLASSTLFSALLLLLLHELRHKLKPVHLRALADLVLLTPAFVLPLASLITR